MFIPFGNIFSLFRSAGNAVKFGFDILNVSTSFNRYHSDKEKLAIILSNPAALKVFCLQCDLFSMGLVGVEDINTGEDLPNDPFLSLIKNPNPLQSQSQFLWDYMFWTMLGTAYCYVDSSIVDRKGNKMYFLEPHKIEWPQSLEKEKDKLIFSDSKFKELMKTTITYRYDDGSKFDFAFDRLISSFDLTNGIGNFFKGPSRIDALYKIISNSEAALDSKNINVRYSGKYLVGSQTESGTQNKPGLSTDEKDDIVNKMESRDKNVFPLRSMVQIRRFVENMAQLQLDDSYKADYFLIGNMYNIPRDVLEAFNSSTFENQEKARAAHVNYTLEPKGEEWMDKYEMHFGYPAQKKNISITWKHLPFMQVFEKEVAETKKIKIDSLTSLLALGVEIEEANEFLGTEFTIKEKEDVQGLPGQEQSTDQEAGGEDQETASGEEAAT